MKLTELDPRWCAAHDAPDGAKQGVSFLCPHCHVQRLAIFFQPTICGNAPVDIKAVHRAQSEIGHLADEHVGRIVWDRTAGDSFADLTLTPSVDASKWGCWHGFIANGEIS